MRLGFLSPYVYICSFAVLCTFWLGFSPEIYVLFFAVCCIVWLCPPPDVDLPTQLLGRVRCIFLHVYAIIWSVLHASGAHIRPSCWADKFPGMYDNNCA